VNTGKFCTECGATEPVAAEAPAAVEDGSWACACGSVNTGKFCPECGSAKPAEAPAPAVCAGCGYEPGEDVPKFCPECGTKFE
jgi:membrane protease subunit (stomatin/prohibitin family)